MNNGQGLPADLKEAISNLSAQLNKERKARRKNPNYLNQFPQLEVVANFHTR